MVCARLMWDMECQHKQHDDPEIAPMVKMCDEKNFMDDNACISSYEDFSMYMYNTIIRISHSH